MSEFWIAPTQGEWKRCPRYEIQVTGCTRQFICKQYGVRACKQIFTKEGINIATTPKTIKQTRFSVKLGMRSVEKIGDTK